MDKFMFLRPPHFLSMRTLSVDLRAMHMHLGYVLNEWPHVGKSNIAQNYNLF